MSSYCDCNYIAIAIAFLFREFVYSAANIIVNYISTDETEK